MATVKTIPKSVWDSLTEIDVRLGDDLSYQLNGGQYRLVRSDVNAGTVPVLTAEIANASPAIGDTLTLTTNARVTATYQWYNGNLEISGANTDSLDTTGMQGDIVYTCYIEDGLQNVSTVNTIIPWPDPVALVTQLPNEATEAGNGLHVYPVTDSFANTIGGTWDIVEDLATLSIDQSGNLSLNTDLAATTNTYNVEYTNTANTATIPGTWILWQNYTKSLFTDIEDGAYISLRDDYLNFVQGFSGTDGEFLTANPKWFLFQDINSTVPAYQPGDPVKLIYGSNDARYEEKYADVNLTDYPGNDHAGIGATVVFEQGGGITVTNNNTYTGRWTDRAQQIIHPGKMYLIEFTITAFGGGNDGVRLRTGDVNLNNNGSKGQTSLFLGDYIGLGTYKVLCNPSEEDGQYDGAYIGLFTNVPGGSASYTLSYFSVKEISGGAAAQIISDDYRPTLTKLPETGAYQMLADSDTFGTWATDDVSTNISGGWNTVTTTTTGVNPRIRDTVGNLDIGLSYFVSVDIKNGTEGALSRIMPFHAAYPTAYCDVSWTGGVPSVAGYQTSAGVMSVPQLVANADEGYNVSFFFYPKDGGTSTVMHLYPSRNGVIGESCDFRNCLLARSDASRSYQRKISAYEYEDDTSDVIWALSFDGVDDYLKYNAKTQIGANPNLITDHTFSLLDQWTVTGGWSLTGTNATHVADGGFNNLSQSGLGLVDGTYYQILVQTTVTAGSLDVRLGDTVTGSSIGTIDATGYILINGKCKGTGDTITIVADTTFAGTVDNVYVNEIGLSTVAWKDPNAPDEYGVELMPNGSFDTNDLTGWTETLTTGEWSIVGGAASITSATATSILHSSAALKAGHTYEHTFTNTGDAITFRHDGGAANGLQYAAGTHTLRIKATVDGSPSFVAQPGETCTIDSVSTKEIFYLVDEPISGRYQIPTEGLVREITITNDSWTQQEKDDFYA